jgi:hypothetical protein
MTRRTAIQPDLFAAEEHRAKLERLGDPLREMEAVIDFAALAAEVEKIAPLKDQPKGGRPPYPIETMVRIVVLKRLYSDNTCRDVHADRGYASKEREEALQAKGYRPQIQRKAKPHWPLLKRQSARNTRIARVRARVEDVFAAIEAMGGKMIRTPSHARAGFALTLMAACYNLRRTVWLVKSGAIPW